MGWRRTRQPVPANPESAATESLIQNAQTVQKDRSATQRTLWIHAASVGEVKSILPLLNHLTNTWTLLPIHVSCNTPEALKILQSHSMPNGINLSADYCAIDFKQAARNQFDRLNPLALIVVETEIWPNLFSTAQRRSVPLLMVNGRIGEKTLNAPGFVTSTYRQLLSQVTCILSRSSTDTENFTKLGVNPDSIKTVGNIKTYTGEDRQPTVLNELAGQHYLLAASTHDPEEQQLCEALADLDLLLVLAPRHAQRSNSLQNTLTEKKISFATRTRNEPITDTTRVYLADTTGEMEQLIAGASMVFVGGSLFDRGGHNVLEPAIQGKPVLIGPYYKNFTAEVDLLSKYQAVCIIDDAKALASTCKRLLDNPEQRREMGNSAKKAIASSRHIFENYTNEIDQLIKQWQKQ